MRTLLLHHSRAGRRLALRRGLEAAGFEVVPVENARVLERAPAEAPLLVDDASIALIGAARATPSRRVVVLGHGPEGTESLSAEIGVDAVAAHFRGETPAPLPVRPDPGPDDLVHGGGLRDVVERIERLAAVDLPVLIEGETGVGKDVVARALHRHGPRRPRPFVTVHVGATAAELLESELFGHARGAFTDAVRDREGRLEAARDGTLLLDDVGDVPRPLQATFLRVLQDRRFSRVGEAIERDFAARVVATSTRPLAGDVAAGSFREDLYHRLAGAVVHVPALRERPEDVAPLVAHLIARTTPADAAPPAVTSGALERLAGHSWPGNVRELDHVLQRARLLAEPEGPLEKVHVQTALADAGAHDPDRDLEGALRRWFAARRARGTPPHEARQALDDLARKVDEDLRNGD